MSAYQKKSTGKRKTTKRTASKKKAPKVYIPAYKAVILCISVILVCVILLLVMNIPKTSSKKTKEPVEESITERFEPEIEKKYSLEIPELEPPKETSESEKQTKNQTAKKSDSDKNEAAKNQETKKTEQKQQEQKEQKQSEQTKPEVKKSEQKEEKKTEQKKSDFGLAKASNGAQLCFVFDDGGQNIANLKEFLSLPFSITVAILPQITHSVESAELVRQSGNEVILHQPMQSINENINPGPGAITPDMTDDQIISQLFVNINQIGPVAGMNNHEGSGITADAEKMALVLQMASENGIYFLDSRTNVETKVPYVAKELGYSYYERNIFLDNEKTRENALSELKKGLAIANKNGSVIMIGHIWSADFLPQLLKELYPELKAKGYSFSVVSKSKALKN
ncbi:MAG: divergent polysaccharide deacetylase family protein [Treponema sp.]|nr:divergent polysaccharide deacetylase family protein [Treponema sp.]